MGILFSRFRAKPTTKELLEDLEKEIESLEDYKRSTELQQKTVVRNLVLYSILLYIICAGLFLFYSFPASTRDRIIYSIPLLVFPILLYILKKFLHWYFLQKIRNNDDNLVDLRKRKRSLLEYAKETETYKVVKELLEKYDPESHRKIFESRPAIEARSHSPPFQKGYFSDVEIRRRAVPQSKGSSPIPLGAPGQSLSMSNAAGSSHYLPILTGKPPSNPPYPPAFLQRAAPPFGFVRAPMPPMAKPILPRERTIVDRLVDYLVGDGPSNRYALICRQCQSHNGMALKEEFEYIAFRCCYCFHWNQPRNQHPPPPRLQLPAPSAPPAITGTTVSEVSTSSEETEIENLSDAESTGSTGKKTCQLNDSTSKNENQSMNSNSEIQANLEEDTRYTSIDSIDFEGEEYSKDSAEGS